MSVSPAQSIMNCYIATHMTVAQRFMNHVDGSHCSLIDEFDFQSFQCVHMLSKLAHSF